LPRAAAGKQFQRIPGTARRGATTASEQLQAVLDLLDGADRMVTPDGLEEAAGWYLAGQDPRHPYASPVHADLRDLPPILIHVGDAEILLDDSVRFAARARAADVEVTLEVWDDMPHCWHTFAGLLPEADQAIERIGHWLRERTAAP
jgi:monoterpene epsilon-lactone hydrolase